MALVEIITLVVNSIVAIAALITLFLISAQLREMNRQTHSLSLSIRSSAYQNIVSTERELMLILNKDKEFMRQHLGKLKIVRKYKINPDLLLNISLLCAHYENVYFQFRQGVVPQELWSEWANAMVNNISKPMILEIWPDLKLWYWDEFAKFIDEELDKKF